MSKEEAYAKLANKDPGTFLVRFGTTQNRFVVSRVSKQKSSDKRVVHNRITYAPSKGFW